MIVVDTNVLSESLKPFPLPGVVEWLRAQDRATLFTTVISELEMFYGVERLPFGKRRDNLMREVRHTFEVDFKDRILDFNGTAARCYPGITLTRQRSGRPISQLDAMIASIARAHNALLATRNAEDFDGCGIRVVNPFSQ